MTASPAHGADGRATLAAHWTELVTVALLGTDRRRPPTPPAAVRDLVDDTARAAPSQRMLAQVAACTAVRRAGVRPAAPIAPMVPPPPDPRPVCRQVAVGRWRHIVGAWPVLEDEWYVVLVANGWRAAPELVPPMLARSRTDAARRARVLAAAGPLGSWLVEQLPELAPSRAGAGDPGPATELPELPIPPELGGLLDEPADVAATAVAHGIESGRFGAAHRAVLVNLVARIPADGLGVSAHVLGAVHPTVPGHGLAAALCDLATTRRRMLDELAPAADAGEQTARSASDRRRRGRRSPDDRR